MKGNRMVSHLSIISLLLLNFFLILFLLFFLLLFLLFGLSRLLASFIVIRHQIFIEGVLR